MGEEDVSQDLVDKARKHIQWPCLESPYAVGLLRELASEVERLRQGQASSELAVSRAIEEVDGAFGMLEKFVDLAGGSVVCGEHVTAIGGGTDNCPWTNALEVLTQRTKELDQYGDVVQRGRRLPDGDLAQDPAFAAFTLGNMEKEIVRLRDGAQVAEFQRAAAELAGKKLCAAANLMMGNWTNVKARDALRAAITEYERGAK